jgi:hypothetical protein
MRFPCVVPKYILRRDIDLPHEPAPTKNLSYFWSCRDLLQRSSSRRGLLFIKNVLCQVWRLGLFCCRSGLPPKEIKSRTCCRAPGCPKVATWLARTRHSALDIRRCVARDGTSSSELILEPGKDAHLRTRVSGKIAEVFVYQGQEVKAGQLLAVLENPEIESTANVAAAELTLASSNLRQNQDQPASGKSARTPKLGCGSQHPRIARATLPFCRG